MRAANATPKTLEDPAQTQTPSFYTAQNGRSTPHVGYNDGEDGSIHDSFLERTTFVDQIGTPAKPIPTNGNREDQALNGQSNMQYGSFVPTPPAQSPAPVETGGDGMFELPAPAISPATPPAMPPETEAWTPKRPGDAMRKRLGRLAVNRSASASAIPRLESRTSEHDTRLLPKRGTGGGNVAQSPSNLRRLFSHGGGINARFNNRNDVGLRPFDLVREREAEFYSFMDSELEKVESFYKLKEDQAGHRLDVLKEQLHEMRNRRIQEIAESSRAENVSGEDRRGSENDRSIHNDWVRPIKAKIFPPGPNSKAFHLMPRTPLIGSSSTGDAGRDYIRRPEDHDVSYRTAKRKLKLAMHEFYRGLELLKSYALLNRTAFRKLNKKFDKAVDARPPYRYMNEKVNKAWFVSSDVLEGHIRVVEDLYARYFERGNHKLAAGKLRSLVKKQGENSGSAFESGFLIGTGLVFSVQGTIYGAQLLFDDDLELRQQTSYLMQVYGGYFLMLLLFSLFCVNCMIWTKSKINYPFIFEFDQRHHLDWRTLAEFPSFFLLLFGICVWTNFSRYGPEAMYLWYPVILIGITVVIILLPFPVIAHRARKWLAYSHVRPHLDLEAALANRDTVAPPVGGHISRRVPRFLPRRHLLLTHIRHSRESALPVLCETSHLTLTEC